MASTRYFALTVLPDSDTHTHTLQPLTTDAENSYEAICSAIGARSITACHYHLWREDGSRAPVTIYIDEEGLLKSDICCYPHHKLNALIDAGRFTDAELTTVDMQSYNQAAKDDRGANYIVGNAVLEVPQDEPLPNLRVIGDLDPIHFLLRHEGQDAPHVHPRCHPFMAVKMPTGTMTYDELRDAIENPTWVSVPYRLAPAVAAPDPRFLAMLRAWNVTVPNSVMFE